MLQILKYSNGRICQFAKKICQQRRSCQFDENFFQGITILLGNSLLQFMWMQIHCIPVVLQVPDSLRELHSNQYSGLRWSGQFWFCWKFLDRNAQFDENSWFQFCDCDSVGNFSTLKIPGLCPAKNSWTAMIGLTKIFGSNRWNCDTAEKKFLFHLANCVFALYVLLVFFVFSKFLVFFVLSMSTVYVYEYSVSFVNLLGRLDKKIRSDHLYGFFAQIFFVARGLPEFQKKFQKELTLKDQEPQKSSSKSIFLPQNHCDKSTKIILGFKRYLVHGPAVQWFSGT